MNDNTETFTYYIGDLAYVLTDEEWDTACAQIPTRYTMQVAEEREEDVDYEGYLDLEDIDIFNEHAGRPFIAMPTMFGDGCYLDRHGKEYSVDSGTIGLINTNYVTDVDKLREALDKGLGHLLTVSTPIDASECFFDDGVITFGGMHSECVEIDSGE